VEAVAVRELKVQFSARFDSMRSDADLLLRLPHGASVGLFARLDATARGIDFSRSEAALFTDEEDLSVLDDKTQRCPLARLPLVPEIVHGGGDYGRKLMSNCG
jgi:hypothetical protein